MLRLCQVVFFALVVRPFETLFIGLRVRGREHVPPGDPFVLVANHTSHLDTVALLSLFPLARLGRIRPVAAADYFERTPLVSLVSHALFNVLTVARAHLSRENNPLERMLVALGSGESLILFPEGTRGRGGEPGHFLPGVAHLVERAPEVPIVPAYLVNMGRALPKGSILPVPFFCEVRLGPPLHPKGSREEIVGQLERAVAALAAE
jgi:1-acyl-sn-glycerol-3-phosphate acyltransferase